MDVDQALEEDDFDQASQRCWPQLHHESKERAWKEGHWVTSI